MPKVGCTPQARLYTLQRRRCETAIPSFLRPLTSTSGPAVMTNYVLDGTGIPVDRNDKSVFETDSITEQCLAVDRSTKPVPFFASMLSLRLRFKVCNRLQDPAAIRVLERPNGDFRALLNQHLHTCPSSTIAPGQVSRRSMTSRDHWVSMHMGSCRPEAC